LFQLAFLGRLNEEEGRPGLERSVAIVVAKMIERHPHVFGPSAPDAPPDGAPQGAPARTALLDAAAVAAAWERNKLERRGRDASLLDGLAASMPSLLAAYRMTQKASGVGFDWSTAGEVLIKVKEELAEVEEAIAVAPERAREEIGDLLFAVANLARHLEVDPEAAAAQANLKFRRRFRHLDGAVVERFQLECAERAVPDQGLGARQHRDHVLDTLGSDVEDHVFGADRVDRNHARRRIRCEFLRHHGVDRQHDFAALDRKSRCPVRLRSVGSPFASRYMSRVARPGAVSR
jgi:NTP pyrophosphatase (non-canonical NTP hydrolase)